MPGESYRLQCLVLTDLSKYRKPVCFQEERDRSNAIVEALRQETSELEEQQKELIRQREAQLEAEKEQREALAQQLEETKVGCPFAAAFCCCFTTLAVLLPGVGSVCCPA